MGLLYLYLYMEIEHSGVDGRNHSPKKSFKFFMCYVTVDSKDVFEFGSFLKDFSVLRPSGFLGNVDW
jgi:hypothetical protein